MKAAVLKRYGGPESIEITNVKEPTPSANEVLVKIHATAVNDYDWSMMRGKPYLYRLMFGIFKPKNHRLGMELSGVVAAVGENTSKFRVGDTVYGDISEYGFGSFAEFISIDENALSHKPNFMNFIDAAAIPHAAALAMQSLVDIGGIQKKQKILVNGAGGGVGTFALLIAKQYGAELTGVDTGSKLEAMLTLGYDHVIDYKQQDFTQNSIQYDLIIDTKTNRSVFAYLSALKAHGRYVTVGGHLHRLIQLLLLKPWLYKLYKKRFAIVALKANKDLHLIEKLYESNQLKPLIDGPYPLAELPTRIQYFGEGKHTGKVIIDMGL